MYLCGKKEEKKNRINTCGQPRQNIYVESNKTIYCVRISKWTSRERWMRGELL